MLSHRHDLSFTDFIKKLILILKTYLDRFKNILHQEDRLQFSEDAVQLGEKSISDLGHLVSRESHIDVQELLKMKK